MTDIVAEFGADYIYVKEKRPNHVPENYSGCWYVSQDGKEPSCLIGRVLYRMGVPLEILGQHEGDAPNGPDLITLLMDSYGFDHNTLNVLAFAQGMQDNGATWGKCLEYVKDKFTNV